MQFSSHKINQKIKLLKVLFIYQTFQNFERTFTVLGKEVFGRDIKIENCSLRLKWSIKKSNFWKFSSFSNSSEVWMNIYRAWRRTFQQGYQKWKLQSSSHKIKQNIKLLKNLFFFQNLQNFERTFTVLGEKIFGRVIKIEKCSFRLIRSTKKSNYWKFSLFIKLFRTLNEQLPCLAKKFWAGISKLKIVLFVFRVSCWG